MATKGTTGNGSSSAKKGEDDKVISKSKSPSPKKVTGGKNYVPNGTGIGGYRPGAGRKPNLEKKEVEDLKAAILDFLEEDDQIVITTARGQQVMVQKKKLNLIYKLYALGIKEGNVIAIKEIFDRAYGKSKQPVEMSGSVKVEDQYVPEEDEALAAAITAYHKTARKLRYGSKE